MTNVYTACIQWDSTDIVRTTAPAGADGIKIASTGRYVAGITTDCNTFELTRQAIGYRMLQLLALAQLLALPIETMDDDALRAALLAAYRN